MSRRGEAEARKPEVYKMYARQGKSVVNIEKLTGVSRRQIYRWINKDNWKKDREDWYKSTTSIIQDVMEMLQTEITTMKNNKKLNGDLILKTVKGLRMLDGEIDRPGITLQVMDLFSKYMRSKSPEGFKIVQKHLPGFLEYARYEYFEKKKLIPE